MYTHVYVQACVCTYMYLCVCVCVCVFKYTHKFVCVYHIYVYVYIRWWCLTLSLRLSLCLLLSASLILLSLSRFLFSLLPFYLMFFARLLPLLPLFSPSCVRALSLSCVRACTLFHSSLLLFLFLSRPLCSASFHARFSCHVAWRTEQILRWAVLWTRRWRHLWCQVCADRKSLQHAATRCDTLQHASSCCNTLHHTTPQRSQCTELQYIAPHYIHFWICLIIYKYKEV